MVTGYRRWQPLAALALAVTVAGCPSLEIINRNAPERERAFSDPATVIASAAGTMKSYINLRYGYEPALGPFSTMADEHSFSWNNFQSRYYSSYGVECSQRCGWLNNTTSSRYEPIPIWWYGAYSIISSANDVLFAIRKSATPPDLGADAGWVETVAQMAQGMAHALVALTYDKGFIVTEETDPTTLQLSTRTEIRDAAITMLDKAATLAASADFSSQPPTLFGVPNSPTKYTGAQMVQIIRTLEAELLAQFPRTDVEDAAVNWGQVVTYASQGISSGTAFDFEAYQGDIFRPGYDDFFTGVEQWGNDYTTTRIDTRVARLLSTTQADPWPGGAGNPQPADASGNPIGGVYGVDKRLGDGCVGDSPAWLNEGECQATARSGTDFAWSPSADFPASRGLYHQSNIGYIRFHYLVGFFPDSPVGSGNFFVLNQHLNDLLWAEGLIRTNTNLGLAATLINRSRVTRGGLPPCTAAGCPPDATTPATTNLMKGLLYEWHVELVSQAADHLWLGRRLSKTSLHSVTNPYAPNQQVYDPEATYVWNPLWGHTPRSMPIPAKDLSLLALEVYSFGGDNDAGGCGGPAPAPVCSASQGTSGHVKGVREIYKELLNSMPKPGKVRKF